MILTNIVKSATLNAYKKKLKQFLKLKIISSKGNGPPFSPLQKKTK